MLKNICFKNWKTTRQDQRSIKTAKICFLRRTAAFIPLGHMRNEKITNEIKIEPTLKCFQQNSGHAQRKYQGNQHFSIKLYILV